MILYGARQVGKTTLLADYLKSCPFQYRLENGDNLSTRHILESQSIEILREYASGYELLAIDEAQKIKGIGQGLKLLVDHVPELRIIATGSSSFDLAGQVGEPLTGRKISLTLFPVSQLELASMFSPFDAKSRLEEWILFGGYPEVVTAQDKKEKIRILEEIAQSYLFKDVLELDKVRNSKTLVALLRLIAFQIGSEVSLSELGRQLGIDQKTVARYCDILEKAFIIQSVQGFSRNLRKEITKKSKYYFLDNGIRNAIIANFNPSNLRDDMGRLWENFLFMERMKKRCYTSMYANSYFWRTWEKQEVDLVEERDGSLYGYEFKWGTKNIRPPRVWKETYPNSSFELIDKDNYFTFVA
ncbi:MAG: ATP-binding protein [Chitinispirillaceae bacterium]|nr:ATP-binding protein [Chitinispirillaceae bacterium]